MSKITTFSHEGDTALAEWEVSDEAAVEKARGVFDEARANGYAAVVPTEAGARTISAFDPAVDEIILLRPIAGGC